MARPHPSNPQAPGWPALAALTIVTAAYGERVVLTRPQIHSVIKALVAGRHYAPRTIDPLIATLMRIATHDEKPVWIRQ